METILNYADGVRALAESRLVTEISLALKAMDPVGVQFQYHPDCRSNTLPNLPVRLNRFSLQTNSTKR